MATGYIVFTEHVTGPNGIAGYSVAAVPSVIATEGTAIIAGAPQRVAEGQSRGDTTVILEFASVEEANAWYDGANYQAVISQRHQAANSNGVVFEGFTPPSLSQ